MREPDPDRPEARISEAEWTVMEVLWARGPQLAQDVVRVLQEDRPWEDQTIRTLLRRLVKKGAVDTTREGKAFRYRAAVERDDCVRDAGRSLLRRLARGSASPLLATFVEEAELTRDEIADLRRLLDEKSKDEDAS